MQAFILATGEKSLLNVNLNSYGNHDSSRKQNESDPITKSAEEAQILINSNNHKRHRSKDFDDTENEDGEEEEHNCGDQSFQDLCEKNENEANVSCENDFKEEGGHESRAPSSKTSEKDTNYDDLDNISDISSSTNSDNSTNCKTNSKASINQEASHNQNHAYAHQTHHMINKNFFPQSSYHQALNHSQFTNNFPPNPDIMNMMFQSEQQLIRTSSTASSTSSVSTCSSSLSTCSSSDLSDSSSLANENHLKALMSSASVSNRSEDPMNKVSPCSQQLTNPALMVAFADQFAYMIRSRSSSVSESSTSSSSGAPSSVCSNSDLMKQMISTYQTTLNKPTPSTASFPSIATQQLLSPSSNKKSTSSALTQPTNQTSKLDAKTDELISKSRVSEIASQGSSTPCKVCGDEASGFHYGVDSCEGCKGFFRRCITQGMNHHCTNNQQCEMTPFSRNSCQFCRLKKCFAVGMSREASRLGRRPKRAKDDDNLANQSPSTTPLKQSLSTQEDKNKESCTILRVSTPISPSSLPNQVTHSEDLTKEKSTPKIKKEKNSTLSQMSSNQAPFKLETCSPEKPIQNYEIKSSLTVSTRVSTPVSCYVPQSMPALANVNSVAQIQKETSQPKMQQIEMFTKLVAISDKHTSIERTNELEFVRTTVIESHLKIWPTTFEKIRKRYVERPPGRISLAYLPSTHYLENFMDAMVPLIMDVVKFCKQIPGFNHILQHDQVQLLKQGSFEVICVNSLMLVDAQNRLMLSADMDYLMDQSTIKAMPLGFFMSEVFDLGIQVAPMKLNDAELALFNALLIMNPDRGDLQDKDHIEEFQATLLHVLYKHLKYYREDGSDLFCKLLQLIPKIQEINRKHSEALNTLNMPRPQQNNSSYHSSVTTA